MSISHHEQQSNITDDADANLDDNAGMLTFLARTCVQQNVSFHWQCHQHHHYSLGQLLFSNHQGLNRVLRRIKAGIWMWLIVLGVQLTLCVKSVDDMNTKKFTLGKVSKTFLRNSSENEGWVGRTRVVESKSLKVGKMTWASDFY